MQTSEILVRLMRGNRFSQLGLTAQEAKRLAEAYISELESYGERAAVIIEPIRRYALEPETPTQLAQRSERGLRQPAAPGEIEARGPPGLPEGAGPDVSGLEGPAREPEFQALAPKVRAAATTVAQKAQGTAVGRALSLGPIIERQVIPRIDDLEKGADQILSSFNPSVAVPPQRRQRHPCVQIRHTDRATKQASIALEKAA
jgi:hypothetical protein